MEDFKKCPFNPPNVYTGKILGWQTNSNKTNKELIKLLEPEGPIKILNTNFGSKCQPGWEFRMVTGPKKKKPKYDKNGNLVVAKSRKKEGHGGCFGSVVEVIIVPDNATAPKSIVDVAKAKYIEEKKIKKNNTEEKCQKRYVFAFFPTVGRFQVIGVTDQNLENGNHIIDLWKEYFHKEGICTDYSKPTEILMAVPTLINYKFDLNIDNEDYRFDVNKFIEILTDIKKDKTQQNKLPFIIQEIIAVSEKQVASFKTKQKNVVPIEVPKKIMELDDKKLKADVISKIKENNTKNIKAETTTKLWFSGKVNMLNARCKENATNIYNFINSITMAHWDKLIYNINDPDIISSDSEDDEEPVVQPIKQVVENEIDIMEISSSKNNNNNSEKLDKKKSNIYDIVKEIEETM